MTANNIPADTDLLYIEDVAAAIGVTVMTLRTMRKGGTAPETHSRLRGRLVWQRGTVTAWLEARQAGRARCTCVIDGCDRSGCAARDGRCSEHSVIRSLVGADRPGPLPYRPLTMTLAERHASWTILDPDGWHLLWTGAVATHGYGRIKVNGHEVAAHRVAWELKHGPIPTGLTVDHLCGEVRCQDTLHMELVSAKENVRREHERLRAQKAATVRSSVPVPDVLAAAAEAADGAVSLVELWQAAAQALPVAA